MRGSISFCRVLLATLMSYSICRFNQNLGSILKNRPRRIAVSAVIGRTPWTISLIRLGETSISAEIWRAVIPIGLIKSCSNISPGWISSNRFGIMLLSVVIHYLDLISSIGFPNETNSHSLNTLKSLRQLAIKEGAGFRAWEWMDHTLLYSIIQNLFNGTFVTFIEVHPLKRMPNPIYRNWYIDSIFKYL